MPIRSSHIHVPDSCKMMMAIETRRQALHGQVQADMRVLAVVVSHVGQTWTDVQCLSSPVDD